MDEHVTPGRDELRQLNDSMADRILSAPDQPLVEGGYALRVLETAGRSSGRPRRTPVGLVQLSGQYFVVAPDQQRDWVRNLDAHRTCRLLTSNAQTSHAAEPVTGPEGAEVVATYLRAMQAPWVWQSFSVPEDASADEIRPRMEALAVFRLRPEEVRR